MSREVELTDEQRGVLVRQYARYLQAQKVAKREAEVLEDLCVSVAGAGFELSLAEGQLVLKRPAP